jgi:hypothetical protein
MKGVPAPTGMIDSGKLIFRAGGKMRISERRKIVADYKKMLIEKHWEQAHFNTKERMWICGLYAASWGLVFSQKIGSNNSSLVFVIPFVLGLFSLAFCLKLNYLYELHILKAQVYLSGINGKRVLTDFGPHRLRLFSISFLFCLFPWLGTCGALLLWASSSLLAGLNTPLFDGNFDKSIFHTYSLIINIFLLGCGFVWQTNWSSFELAKKNARETVWNQNLHLK